MSQHSARHGQDSIRETRNFSRFCVENRQIAWVLLLGTVIWGIYGFLNMPQRKDPEIPVKQAMVITSWPGASAERVEDLVTRSIERTLASNANVARIESTSRSNVSVVVFSLADELEQTGQVLDDIGGRLASVQDLPDGAGPINYIRDFGDTATLMLTVASPKADAAELTLRGREVRAAIEAVRAGEAGRVAVVFCLPLNTDLRLPRLAAIELREYFRSNGAAREMRIFEGPGFIGIDGMSELPDQAVLAGVQLFVDEHYPRSELHPDLWQPFLVRDPSQTQEKLAAVAGEKYSYRELEDFTEIMERALLGAGRTGDAQPLVAKVSRSGVLAERVYLVYSQERLAAYGIKTDSLPRLLQARNVTVAGGQFEAGRKSVFLNPSGEFHSEREIGDVSVGFTPYGTPLYLRDLTDTARAYETARYLNFFSWRDSEGQWQRTRAVTLSVQMGSGKQIDEFARAVDLSLQDLRNRLPRDLIVARVSDQPQQVEENVELFMSSLYEAVGLVVLVSLIGFWEWRSALLMALSIPLTLLMTFGFMHVLGIDIQQVSVASLIIALGLLVDDPVVAGDAIKRELASGERRDFAAWLGPTRLATAILYATITNIVAYLPFLFLGGTTGQFLYSLPVVLACALVASRVVSMSFIPLLGFYLLKGKAEPAIEERRSHGFSARYYRLGRWAIRHRWLVMLGSLGILAAGLFIAGSLKQQFFPKDLSRLAFVNIFLPEDAPFSATSETAVQVERIILEACTAIGTPLESLSTFVGGGAPRFWYSLAPEAQRPNYAQVVLLFENKHDTQHAVPAIQESLSRKVAGALIDVRQLETGDAVGLPVAIRLSGEDADTLRSAAESVKVILREHPLAVRVRDNWGEDRFNVELEIDPDRANRVGITNADVARSSAAAVNGSNVTVLREGDKQIPVVAKLRANERANLQDLSNLYVYSSTGEQKVPLRQVSSLSYSFRPEVIQRRNQFRTITVSAAPREGALASEIMVDVKPKLEALGATLPPGYRLEIGGETEKQEDGFLNLVVVLAISVVCIFLALTFQFKNAVKPFIVFATVPYGAVGALFALWVMGTPFGFMGFLGVVSLVGVIVSHIIVLFDFIEEKHAEGEPFELAVLDAGIMRLRPVLITVGATVIALFPLAAHGGPLWEPMCYAQIGGLTAATFVTLLLVPVFYSVSVLDLKIVKWEESGHAPE